MGLVKTPKPGFQDAETPFDDAASLAVGGVVGCLLGSRCGAQRRHQPRLQRIAGVAYRQETATVCVYC